MELPTQFVTINPGKTVKALIVEEICINEQKGSGGKLRRNREDSHDLQQRMQDSEKEEAKRASREMTERPQVADGAESDVNQDPRGRFRPCPTLIFIICYFSNVFNPHS